MAYNRRYESTYFSLNGRQYYLEIRDQNWPSGIGVKEADLGIGGCSIHYDADGDQRYAQVIASKMDIPFIVKDGTDAIFIKNLIEDYNEEDVVVALYIGGSAQWNPVWSGYLLMDLGAQQDVSYPYEVKLTATDGLARLKDIGFWDDETTSLTYKDKGMERITYWLGEILNKITPPGTSQGITNNARMRISVNWYNEQHQSAAESFGPLYYTRIKMGMMENEDSQSTITVQNCYEVLVNICKTFGMRCIYWKHFFYFIQITEYNTAESGTVVDPDNINTRDYTLADPPVHLASYDNLGSSWWTRYSQNIENQTTPGKGIQKLAGTTYLNYPILKKVSADFISASGKNHYGGFPEETPGPNKTGSVFDSVEVVQDVIEDPQTATKLLLKIPLTFQQDTSVGSYDNRLDTYKVEFKCYLKAIAGSGATGTSPQYLIYSGGSYTWDSSAPAWNEHMTLTTPNLTAADTGVQELTPPNSNGGQLPTLSGVTGTWSFKLVLQSYPDGGTQDPVRILPGLPSTLIFVNGENYAIHGVKWANAVNPNAGVITPFTNYSSFGFTTQSWTATNGNPFLGTFMVLNSSLSVGAFAQRITSVTSESDTSSLYLDQLNWGDSPMDTDDGAIQVWNGSAWIYTDFSGDWGVGTITPTTPLTLTALLLNQYLQGQSFHVYKMNARITLSTHNKYITDASGSRPKYINPIGKINDVDGKSYVFLRGTFATGDDTWDGEWFNIGEDTPTITTTVADLNIGDTPASDGFFPGMKLSGSNVGVRGISANLVITTLSERIAATDIVTNGQFIEDASWTKGSGVTIGDDQLKFSSVASGIGALNAATVSLTTEYFVKFTVSSYSSGGVQIKLGETLGTAVTANGDYTQNITPATSTTIDIVASESDTTLNVDGIIIIARTKSIKIEDIGETLLADGYKIALIEPVNGNIYELTLDAAQTSGDTSLTIVAYDFEYPVEQGAVISFDTKNIIQGGSVPTLQEVTDEGNTTTNSIMIGSASAPSEKLHIFGTAPVVKIEGDGITSANLSFGTNSVERWIIGLPSGGTRLDFNNGSSDVFTILSSGNVGIGTTVPGEILHISDTAAVVKIEGSGVTSAYLNFETNGTDRWNIGVPSGQTRLNFNNGSSDLVNILQSGNVGIGTTSPSANLHIYGNTNDDVKLKIENDFSGKNAQLYIDSGASGDGYIIFNESGSTRGLIIYDGGIDLLKITNGYSSGDKHLAINNSGHVGIGTFDPQSALQINGATTLTAMAEPSDPTANDCVIWLDSTTLDLKVKITGESSTVTRTLASFSE